MRNDSGLAIRRHQWGDSRKGDQRPLQGDGEHHDDGDELTLHTQRLTAESCRSKLSIAKALISEHVESEAVRSS